MTALEQILAGVPPEKYYEACITYHLVREQERRGRRLYPFAISQAVEHQLGFDFGYGWGRGFLAQYKRPILRAEGCGWIIDLEQFQTLRNCGVPAYYVLPRFFLASEWYEGLDLTAFLSVSALEPWIQERKGQKEACLGEEDPVLALETPEAKLYKALDRIEAVIQHNEAPLETWIELERTLNLEYGVEDCAAFPFMSELRELAAQDTREKLARG